MCTLITLWRSHPAAPLILALNRDEFLDRPTADLEIWKPHASAPPILSGRDLRGGGTWFGVGPNIVAALTNHRSGERSRPGHRSRGDLVVRALTRASVAEARNDMLALPGNDYGPFHLMACDGEAMIWITNRSGVMEASDVAPGLHVLGNYGFDNEADPVVAHLHKELQGLAACDSAGVESRLKLALASHGPGRPCIHLGPYGTRSSALLRWGGTEAALAATAVAPCVGSWSDYSRLLGQVRGESS